MCACAHVQWRFPRFEEFAALVLAWTKQWQQTHPTSGAWLELRTQSCVAVILPFLPVGIWYLHIFQLTLSGLWQSGDIYRIYSWCWRFEVYWAGISQKFQQHKHCRPNFSNQQTQWWLHRDRDGGALLVGMMVPTYLQHSGLWYLQLWPFISYKYL